jgi:hypothetical protein
VNPKIDDDVVYILDDDDDDDLSKRNAAKVVAGSRRRSNSFTSYEVAIQRLKSPGSHRIGEFCENGNTVTAINRSNSNDSLPGASGFWTLSQRLDGGAACDDVIDCDAPPAGRGLCDGDDCSLTGEGVTEEYVLPLLQRLALNASDERDRPLRSFDCIGADPSSKESERPSQASAAVSDDRQKKTKELLATTSSSSSTDSGVVACGTKRRRNNLKKRVAEILTEDVFVDDFCAMKERQFVRVNSFDETTIRSPHVDGKARAVSKVAGELAGLGKTDSIDTESQSLQDGQNRQPSLRRKDNTPMSGSHPLPNYSTPWSARHVGNFQLETSVIGSFSGAKPSVGGLSSGAADETQDGCRSVDDTEHRHVASCDNDSLRTLELSGNETPDFYSIPLAERLRRRQEASCSADLGTSLYLSC